MTINLIITADDCGMTPGINAEVVDLCEAGILTTGSVMMNMPHVSAFFKQIGTCTGFEMGVHLNLTDGRPLTPIEPLSPITRADGTFRDAALLYAQAVFGPRQMMDLIEAELRAQIDYFIALAGFNPGHITTHMHFHIVPALLKLVYDLAMGYDIPWVRANQYRASLLPMDFITNLPQANPNEGPMVPDYVTAMQFWTDRSPKELYEQIKALGSGMLELVVHPGCHPDGPFPVGTRRGSRERAEESAALRNVYPLLAQDPDIVICNVHSGSCG